MFKRKKKRIQYNFFNYTESCTLIICTAYMYLCMYVSVGEGNGNPLQYSYLENPMAGGAWQAAVHGVAQSRTQLSDFSFPFHFHALEKEMATHSSVLAWRIPWTEEPNRLQSIGSQESDTTQRLNHLNHHQQISTLEYFLFICLCLFIHLLFSWLSIHKNINTLFWNFKHPDSLLIRDTCLMC